MVRKNKIQKVLSVGDFVYSRNGGKPMQVKKVDFMGFETEKDYFTYDEHGELYFLTERGYKSEVNQNEKL